MTLKNQCPEELDKIIRRLSGPAHQYGLSTSFACSALYVYKNGGTMPAKDELCLKKSGLLTQRGDDIHLTGNGWDLLNAYKARGSRVYLWAEDRAEAARKAAQAPLENAHAPCPCTPK